MPESEALCPECGSPLSASVEIDEETKAVKVLLQCEGDGDDIYWFEINTGLTNEKLGQAKRGSPIPMIGQVLEREADPEKLQSTG